MKWLTLIQITVLSLAIQVAPAYASGEQRVLLSFDNSGHHVQRVIRSESFGSLRQNQVRGDISQADSVQEAIAALEPGRATLVWLDDAGNWYASTREPDPRVSHSPEHITGANASQAEDTAGAWLVSGPGRATRLIILLPSDISLGLGYEQWELDLIN